MIIKKKNTVAASTDGCEQYTDIIEEVICPENSGCKYEAATILIKQAIETLALNCPDDEVAKDSIANLSVVLMDLTANC